MNSFAEILFPLILMPALLVISAFFSCTETALFSLTAESSRRLRAGRHSGVLMDIFYREPSELLTAVLLGNLFVNILFFCTGSVLTGRWAAARGEWIEAAGGLILLVLVILFGELIPKAVGIALSAGVVRVAAVPLHLWFLFTFPFRRMIRHLLNSLNLGENHPVRDADLTAGELKELLDAVRHEPGFSGAEKEVFEDIVNLPEVRVREVMVPRVKVLCSPLQSVGPELVQSAVKNEFSYIVVYRENDNDLLGCLHVVDLFHLAEQPVASIVRPLVFVPETRRVDLLLNDFFSNGWKIVAVVDEYGGFSGIVTLEDLLGEVVGGLEPGAEEEIVKLDETTYRLSGQLSIRAWQDLLTGILPGHDIGSMAFDTLGGLITSLLGRVAVARDTVQVRNLKLTVESMHRNRIETVLLHLNPPEATA